MIYDNLGKKAEQKIKEWLDRPDLGYDFNRIPDQMTGLAGSRNICDFDLFISPNRYYIESKATWKDRFEFNRITEYQYQGLLRKSKISNVYGVVIVLFAAYQRAFIIDINEIDKLIKNGKKSINIKKIGNWDIKYTEIQTVPSRKNLLDYTGRFTLSE